MVFDGKHLSSFDTNLLDELKQAQAMPTEPDAALPSSRQSHPLRRDRQVAGLVMAAFVVLAVLAGAVVATHRSGGGDKVSLHDPHRSRGVAEQQVLAALAQTTQAGTFDVTYRLSETLGSTPPQTICPGKITSSVGGSTPTVIANGYRSSSSTITGSGREGCYAESPQAATVSGSGSVVIAPKAMTVSADIGYGSAPASLGVTLTLTGDNVSESSSPPTLLSGFAPTVEGSLGLKEGALAMTQMASPNAYLSLEGSAVTGASVAGHSTVDGVAVTDYTVDIDLDQLLSTPGLSSDETKTITDALAVLHDQGLDKTVETISVDDAGYIRRVASVTSFGDGATVTQDATYSNFGCTQGSSGLATCSSSSTTSPSTTSPSTTIPPAATTLPEATTTTT